ncbi:MULTISPECIES: DUF6434 domain-containing protein [unclassified Janthinobacterium]|uniref:DUF6434 domain-containing protein n=1 Tax=unclassified Janthinobacterium TaxID=2610881 RepID=UPI00088A2C69|nr:hypothetical protein SAMN03159349_02087 [Janthinobacterium sp. 551a]SFB27867.1 hypothetical protein SAMN03159300_10392 [Janthinobacterium sp. 344]
MSIGTARSSLCIWLLTRTKKSTQNVWRFLLAQCKTKLKLEHEFMAWIGDRAVKTRGYVADEWTLWYGQAG